MKIKTKLQLTVAFLFLTSFSTNLLAEDIKPIQANGLSNDLAKNEMVAEQGLVVKEDQKVYLDFRETDIKEVARVLSKLSNRSILVSEGVNALVTVNLEDIPWRQALDVILKTYHLAVMEDGEFLIIVSYDQVKAQEVLAPLETKIIPLNFADIENIKEIIEGSLTERGTVRLDERTKSLIITDTRDVIKKVEVILKSIDTSTPQVLIEVLMVDKKIVDEFEFGVNWSLLDADFTEGFEKTSPGGLGEGLNQDMIFKFAEQPFESLAKESFSFGMGSIVGDDLLAAVVEMWQQNKIATVIANPRVLTLDNEEATIEIIEKVPYQEIKQTAEGATLSGTAFMDIGVTMTVAPQITQDGHIILNLLTEQEFQTGTSSTGVPVVDSRKSESKMMVGNESTIAIGGLRRKNKSEQEAKVPILGDLPLLGNLFKQKRVDETITELIIFVTSTIYRDGMPLTEAKALELEINKKAEDVTAAEVEINDDNEFYFLEEEKKTTSQKTKEYAEEIKAIELDPSFDTIEMLPLRTPY